jgi:hypothetical protein
VVRDRGAAFERFSRAVDGPLTVLALALIPLIVLPLVMDLSPGTESAFLAIDYLIWAVFAAEYAIKRHCCIWRSLKPASSTRVPKRHP